MADKRTTHDGYVSVSPLIEGYVRKGGKNQIPANFERPPPPPPFKPASPPLHKAIEIQSAYAKSAYERFVAQATKIAELAKEPAPQVPQPAKSRE
jgi:hypothetical protein